MSFIISVTLAPSERLTFHPRSISVDIYDGDDEPIVYHGKTLTGSVSVRAVCVAIASYAFMASPYPIIISAEMHCGPEQQLKLVDILNDVFGEQLVTAELGGIGSSDESKELAELPSPEQLKYRILFKVSLISVVAASC